MIFDPRYACIPSWNMGFDTDTTCQDQGCHQIALSATRTRETIMVQSFNGKLHMWPNSRVFDISYPTVMLESFHQISQQFFFRSNSCTNSNEASPILHLL